jgi:hypothetical protein
MSTEARARKGWRDVLPIHPAADLFPRMSPDELKALGEDIKKNGLRAPVVVHGPPGNFCLLDGRNRLDAMELVGLPVIEQVGDKLQLCPHSHVALEIDPYAFVLSANLHRRHLTAEQKREIIAKVLKAQPEKSNRQIAKQVKADHKTVSSERKKLEATGELPQLDKTTGADGKARPAKKKRHRDVDDFLADKREAQRLWHNVKRAEAEAAAAEDAINQFIREFLDCCSRLTAWHKEHPDLPTDGRRALDHNLTSCANEILLLAQAIRETAPAEVPAPTVPTAITTTPAGPIEIPDLPEFLRRTA